MKKRFIVAICLAVLSLAVLLAVLGNNFFDRPKIKSVKRVISDSGDVFTAGEIYDFGEYKIYTDETIEKQKTISFMGKELEVSYINSYDEPLLYYDVDVYVDSSGNEYELKKNTDEVLGCRNNSGIYDLTFDCTSEDRMISGLEDIAGVFIDANSFVRRIDTQVISFGDNETRSRNEEGFYSPGDNEKAYYTVTYLYPFCGWNSLEKLELNIRDNRLISCYYTLPGAFSKRTDSIGVDLQEIHDSIDAFVTKNVNRDKYENVRYEIIDSYLSENDEGKMILISVLNMSFDKKEGGRGNSIETIVLEMD